MLEIIVIPNIIRENEVIIVKDSLKVGKAEGDIEDMLIEKDNERPGGEELQSNIVRN
jgi:hypothetical protein